MYVNKQVLFGGTCRTWGRGVPDCVIQKEVKNLKKQAEASPTTIFYHYSGYDDAIAYVHIHLWP